MYNSVLRDMLQQERRHLSVGLGFAEGSRNKQGLMAAGRALVLGLALVAAILAHRRTTTLATR
jgi:hypothetical protein